MTVLCISVVFRPRLPTVRLLETAPVQERQTFMERVRSLRQENSAAALLPVLPLPREVAGAPEVTGFYVNWDDNSFSSLKQHLKSLTELDAEWLHLTSAGLTPDDPVKSTALLSYLQAHQSTHLRLVPLINNYDNRTQSWDSRSLALTLHDARRRVELETRLLSAVARIHAGGLMIDFEQIPPASQPEFVTFMRELHARTAQLGLRLNVALPLDDDNYPYAGLCCLNRVRVG